jgi:hypothetical protein
MPPSGGISPEDQSQVELLPQSVGGPDDFGYTWDDGVAFNWIDATLGTDTGLVGDTMWEAAGPVSLPFPFRFYEEIYSHVFISGFGYLSFDQDYYWPRQQRSMPSMERPNNVIAPFWTVTYLQNSGGNGKVYYHSGGVAPNRYFVVEWHNVQGGTVNDPSGGDENYRFEVVLFETGDILFQYHTMTFNDWRYYASIGIEDPSGNGLGYMDYYNYWERLPYANKAIRFYRPAPAARVSITPLTQGEFNQPGGSAVFTIPVRNTGELGSDVYDISFSSVWPVELYADDGVTPLTDTDSDGVIDTGPVSQNSIKKFIAKVKAPAGTAVGAANTSTITVTSSLDIGKSKIVTLQSAIPTSFAQVYRDNSKNGMLSLYLVQPAGQKEKFVTESWSGGWDPAIAEAPNGNFIYTWSRGHCIDDTNCNIYVSEIEYTVVNKYGEIVRPVTKLTNLSSATMHTYDSNPVVAVASNGRIGIVWYRYQYQSIDPYLYNFNIYMALLDSNGSPVYSPANLTNNNSWGNYNTLNAPDFYNPRIAATGDNRFVLAWQRYMRTSNDTSLDYSLNDIYYAVRDSNGGSVLVPTQFTSDTWGTSTYEGYRYPNLADLANNRVLLTFSRESDSDIYIAVLGSDGSVIKGQTNLSLDSQTYFDYAPDAVQLSDGKIAVAWEGYQGMYKIRFAILDAAYNKIAGPTTLTNPAAVFGENSVSISADQSGRAVLTWRDTHYYNNIPRNLYYALVSSSGAIVTQPMIFRMSEGSYPYIETSSGYGNTTYSSIGPNPDGALTMSGSVYGATPGGAAIVPVSYTNHGNSKAEDITLTLTYSIDLTYLSDTSGITPSLGAGTVTWDLSALQFLEENTFLLNLGVPEEAAIGDLFPLTLDLSVADDTNLSNNTFNANVMAGLQLFLSFVNR